MCVGRLLLREKRYYMHFSIQTAQLILNCASAGTRQSPTEVDSRLETSRGINYAYLHRPLSRGSELGKHADFSIGALGQRSKLPGPGLGGVPATPQTPTR